MSTDSQEEKTLDAVYRQRGEAWMLAMAFAKLAGFEVGVRELGEWPVHVIYLPKYGEVALHMKNTDTVANVLTVHTARQYDNHTDQEKSDRIRNFVRQTFS